MEKPLAVICNAAAGYVGRTYFDLLVYPDRFLSVKASNLRDMPARCTRAAASRPVSDGEGADRQRN
jgi:hypothetical protein